MNFLFFFWQAIFNVEFQGLIKEIHVYVLIFLDMYYSSRAFVDSSMYGIINKVPSGRQYATCIYRRKKKGSTNNTKDITLEIFMEILTNRQTNKLKLGLGIILQPLSTSIIYSEVSVKPMDKWRQLVTFN